jgi:excinuclease ABC subunit C
MQARVDDPPSEILAGFLGQFYTDAAIVPPSILLQHPLPSEDSSVLIEWLHGRRGSKVEIAVPKRGNKHQLVEMVAKSAAENLEQSRLKFLSDEQRMTAAMTELAEALGLPRLPRRIECFDISNLHGTNPVASMVVFEDGRPAKKEYRRFAIKTVEGSNDFAMMAEVIRRRFKRAAESAADGDDEPERGSDGKWTALPDVVIVDGGKGQLGAALGALDDVGWADQPIVALAKRTKSSSSPAAPIRSSCRAIRRRSSSSSGSVTRRTGSR